MNGISNMFSSDVVFVKSHGKNNCLPMTFKVYSNSLGDAMGEIKWKTGGQCDKNTGV